MNYTALDTSALAWLLPELKAGLFKVRSELMRAQETSPQIALQTAKAAMHEAAGALQIMDAKGLIQFAQALEGAISFLIAHDDEITQDALDMLDQACHALVTYLEDIQNSSVLAQPVVLYAYYDDLHALQGTQRYHAADLYFPPLSARFSLPSSVVILSADALKRVRRTFEHHLLPVLKDVAKKQDYEGLQTALAQIAAAQSNAQTHTFWSCCEAVLETLVDQSSQTEWLDLDIKRWVARINLQLRRLAEGSPHIAERLYREALYFVAAHLAQLGEQPVSTKLSRVSEAFHLHGTVPENLMLRPYRRLDEAKLSQAKQVLKSLKVLLDESVHHNAATDGVQRSSVMFEQRFTQARKELGSLTAHLKDLGLKDVCYLSDTLAQVLGAEADKSLVLSLEMSMQTASSLLLIEQGIVRPNLATNQLIKQRTHQLQAFLQGQTDLATMNHFSSSHVDSSGLSSGSLADDSSLNEALTREITSLLATIEKNLDDYFRKPTDASVLSASINSLTQLESSFGMLELPAAQRAVQMITIHVNHFIGHTGTENDHLFKSLAEEFGRLSVLVDLFGKTPHLARLHFSYDEVEQKLIEIQTVDAGLELELGGKGDNLPFESVETLAEQRQTESQALMRALIAQPDDVSTKLALENSLKALKIDAELIGDDALANQTTNQLVAVGQGDLISALAGLAPESAKNIELSIDLETHSTGGQVASKAEQKSAGPTSYAIDAIPSSIDVESLSFEQEMLATFLEEAQEVIDSLAPWLDTLKAAPADQICLSNIRRAFHTLKGSGRMVGLNELGDAAWFVEKRLNDVLTSQTPMPTPLLENLFWAHQQLQTWVHALQSSQPHTYTATLFETRFDPSVFAIHTQNPDEKDNEIAVIANANTAASASQSEVEADLQLQPQSLLQAPVLSELLSEQAKSAMSSDVSEQPNITSAARPRISLVTDNSARLAQDFVAKNTVPRASMGESNLVKPSVSTPAGIKVVGPIKLPMPLYAIYIAESEEHILQLEADLLQWRQQTEQGCSYEAYRFAHSLKGGAATVGFGTLRDIASSLEAVLDVSHKRKLPLTTDQFALVQSTVQTLKAMHSAFAQGTYPAGDYDLVVALSQLSTRLNATQLPHTKEQEVLSEVHAIKMPVIVAPFVTEAQPDKPASKNTQLDHETFATSDAMPSKELDDFAKMLGSFAMPKPEAGQTSPTIPSFLGGQPTIPTPIAGSSLAKILPLNLPDLTSFSSAQAQTVASKSDVSETGSEESDITLPQNSTGMRATVLDAVSTQAVVVPAIPETEQQLSIEAAEDPISEQLALLDDEIEPAILPDFIEEADELMPQCAQWMMDLEQRTTHAGELRRGLHTLKGGARMAGAMKLGAVLHMLESDIESLLLQSASHTLPQTAHLHLIELFDRAQHLYDVVAGRAVSKNFVPASTSAQTFGHATSELKASNAELQAGVVDARDFIAGGEITPAVIALPQTPSNDSVDQQISISASNALSTVLISNQAPASNATSAVATLPAIRLRTDTLNRLVNQAGEVTSSSARLDQHVLQLRNSLKDLTENVERIRNQLREVEIQAELQLNTRLEQTRVSESQFDPLEFDRFTRFQELTRMLAESLSDMVSLRDNVASTLMMAERDLAEQSKITRDLTQSLMRTRLVQFDVVADRLYRVARQAARDLGKHVELDIQGGTVELDRSILERMTAPLEHLVRNCLAHGIELPTDRAAAGKPTMGKIVVATRQVGNEIELTVQDDGAGLDLNRIRQQAITKGLIADDAMPGYAQLAEFIFLPGFSTASEITQVSGRGVGMDVVRSEAAALGGRVNIEMFQTNGQGAEKGSKFVIRLPLTLAVNQVLLVRVAETVFAVPAALIENLTTVPLDQLVTAYQSRHLEQRGYNYPFAYLGALLELEAVASAPQQRSAQVLLIHSGNERVAVHIDAVLGNQEVVVKNIGSMLSRIQGINSATVLGADELCLIIDPGQLWLRQSGAHNAFLALGSEQGSSSGYDASAANKVLTTSPAAPMQRKLAMVVDDSLTVRKVTQRLLIRENWQVVLAKDGVDALEQLQSLVPDVMLVDIEMPRMDGFDLTRNVRADERLAHVPIIMITSRMADKHKQYAKELGVNAYLGKPYHDDELLQNMAELTSTGHS